MHAHTQAVDDKERCLVYPLCADGSLEDRLRLKDATQQPLTCQQRVDVAHGVACALAALHGGRRVHRDVKSSNVLLQAAPEAADAAAAVLSGAYITPLLSDCGIARCLAPHGGGVATRTVKGTLGYLDPVYHSTGLLHASVDIFSFGVVLLELLTSQVSRPAAPGNGDAKGPPGGPSSPPPPAAPPLVARMREQGGGAAAAGAALADPAVTWQPEVVTLLTRLAQECVHPDVGKRPSAAALAGQLAALARPPVPPVFAFKLEAELPDEPPTPTGGAGGKAAAGGGGEDDDKALCVACLESPQLPCGHVILCAQCVGPPPPEPNPGRCPLCGTPETMAAFGTGGSEEDPWWWMAPAAGGPNGGDNDSDPGTSSEYIAASDVDAGAARSGGQVSGVSASRLRSRRRAASRRRGLACVAPLTRMRGSPLGELMQAVGTALDDLTAGLRAPPGRVAGGGGSDAALGQRTSMDVPAPLGGDAAALDAEAATPLSTPDGRTQAEVQRMAASLGPLVHLLGLNSRHAAQEVAAGVMSILAMEYLTTVAIAESGALAPLVALLRNSHPTCREAAASALANVAAGGTDLARKVARAGAVGPLVRLLAAPSGSHWSGGASSGAADGGRDAAARAVRNLAAGCSDVAAALVHAGAVPPLLHLLRTGTFKGREAAAGALGNLASVPGARDACSAAFTPLVRMMTGAALPERRPSRKAIMLPQDNGGGAAGTSGAAGDADAIAAAVAIQALVAAHPGNRDAAVTAGCLPPLIAMLSGSKACTPEARAAAAGALCNLAAHATQVQQALTQPEPLAALAAALKSARSDLRTTAAAAGCVCNLCVGADEGRATAIACGDLLPPLLHLLALPDFSRTAAKSVKHLAGFHPAVEALVKRDAVAALSDVLDELSHPVAAREAAANAVQALCVAAPLLVAGHAQAADTARRLAVCCRDTTSGTGGESLRTAATSALAALARASPSAADEVATVMTSVRAARVAPHGAEGQGPCHVQ